MLDPNQRGLIANWGLGSGKSLGAIAVADALGKPADVVAPAALGENFRKEINKHTDPDARPDVQIHSLENLARKGGTQLNKPLLVLDEAHRIRNSGKARNAINESTADKRLLLTGSLLYNNPADLAGPVNTVAGQGTLPASPTDFNQKFVRTVKINPSFWQKIQGATPGTFDELNPRHADELRQILKKYVDFHPGNAEGMPERRDETVRVPMTDRQRAMYDAIIGKAPAWVRMKVRAGLPPSKAESGALNEFLAAGRQISNTTAPYQTEGTPDEPKIQRAAENLKKFMAENPDARAAIYSNYLDAGLTRYKSYLDEAKIPYGMFTGTETARDRDQAVRDYNEGKIRALLLSGAGGEGLDLKGTRLMQILDPNWNHERINQAIGRAVRYKSHDALPEDQRNVLVQRYLSTLPRSGLMESLHVADPGMSPDEYLNMLSDRKEKVLNQFRDLYRK
jgi:SNF2 family DNA or RNA helicase